MNEKRGWAGLAGPPWRGRLSATRTQPFLTIDQVFNQTYFVAGEGDKQDVLD